VRNSLRAMYGETVVQKNVVMLPYLPTGTQGVTPSELDAPPTGAAECWVNIYVAAPAATWRTFLDHHVRDLISLDFFVVPNLAYYEHSSRTFDRACAKRSA
jgi:hypothetical protein